MSTKLGNTRYSDTSVIASQMTLRSRERGFSCSPRLNLACRVRVPFDGALDAITDRADCLVLHHLGSLPYGRVRIRYETEQRWVSRPTTLRAA